MACVAEDEQGRHYLLFGAVRTDRNDPHSAETAYAQTGRHSNVAEFGLMYYNARWYDPTIARFTQADTIVPDGVQGLDRYAYANNSPATYSDPSGHMVDQWGGEGACYPPGSCQSTSWGGGEDSGGGNDATNGEETSLAAPLVAATAPPTLSPLQLMQSTPLVIVCQTGTPCIANYTTPTPAATTTPMFYPQVATAIQSMGNYCLGRPPSAYGCGEFISNAAAGIPPDFTFQGIPVGEAAQFVGQAGRVGDAGAASYYVAEDFWNEATGPITPRAYTNRVIIVGISFPTIVIPVILSLIGL